ncbi:MAG: malate/lactate/ureidoglycolate dehydrogenase [Pelovirga sp.]
MKNISGKHLKIFARAVLTATGSSSYEADIVAEHLVQSNLAGHDSHGIGMIPAYLNSIRNNALVPDAERQQVLDHGAMMVFDGGRGYGQRLAKEAMATAIERCRENGLVFMGLRNAHHMGRIGSYGEQAIAAGFVSLHFVNVVDHRPLVAPFRGTAARYSTNPICLAMPAKAEGSPILLDMATSRTALGKVRVAMNKGEQMAAGILYDGVGKASTDPSVMFTEPFGAITALGDYKGYGIAFFCELLAGVLTGGGTIQPENPKIGGIVNHMATILIDPQRLIDYQWMEQEIAALVSYVKSAPADDSALPVLVAGEPEMIARAQRAEKGIPVDDTTCDQLIAAAQEAGVVRPDAEELLGL